MNQRDDISDIINYYRANQEANRSQTQQLEFRLTLKILEQHLPPRSKILELGAGIGFYTALLAAQGHHITAVEPVAEMIESGKKVMAHLKLSDQVTWVIEDARTVIAGSDFDAVLIMGPLYHLIKAEDRAQVISNSSQCLKANGLMFSAWLTRSGFLSYIMVRQPLFIQQKALLDEVMQHGHYLNHPRDGSFRGYFAHRDEIMSMPEGFESVGVFSQDPCIGGLDDIFNTQSNEVKALWTDYLFLQSGQPELLGSGRSVMSISRKKGS